MGVTLHRGGRESRPQGEGRQGASVSGHREVREMRDAATVLGIIRERWVLAEGKLLESRMRRKPHVRFGGGPSEQCRTGGNSPAAYPT